MANSESVQFWPAQLIMSKADFLILYKCLTVSQRKYKTRQAGWTWSSSLKNIEYWLMLVITELHPSLMSHHPRNSTGFYRHNLGITCLVIMWHRNDRTHRTLCLIYFSECILCPVFLFDKSTEKYFFLIWWTMNEDIFQLRENHNHCHWNVCLGKLKERKEGWLHQLVSELHSAAGIPIIQLVTRITCYHPLPMQHYEKTFNIGIRKIRFHGN